MGYLIDSERMDALIKAMQREYRFFAPRYEDNQDAAWKKVRYGEIDSISDIVWESKSDDSPKEILFPIVQELQYFYENMCRKETCAGKKILLFARPCDIYGIQRLDTMFLMNGGTEDPYYKENRSRVKLVLMECLTGWDTCFCVSMGTNQTDDYAIALRYCGNHYLLNVQDAELALFFSEENYVDYLPEFIKHNSEDVKIPEIEQKDVKAASQLSLWSHYAEKCLSCGKCTAVCVGCSCFSTITSFSDEYNQIGKRERVWASCMHEDFSRMAGGIIMRKTAADRLRFRILHKIYDYKMRFESEHMCVGCGRCIEQCPANISIIEIIHTLFDSLQKKVFPNEQYSES